MKILKTRNRQEQEEIMSFLNDIDNDFLAALRKLRGLHKFFINKRDIDLIRKLKKTAEQSANRILLLEGRIRHYELGLNVFRDGEMLEYSIGSYKGVNTSTIKYIPFIKSNYSGEKFKNFKEKDIGATAKIATIKNSNKKRILSILIPRNKYKLIRD